MAARRTAPKASKAPGARKLSVRRKRVPTITHDDIAVRAYYLHLEGGGDPLENWVRAEREFAAA